MTVLSLTIAACSVAVLLTLWTKLRAAAISAVGDRAVNHVINPLAVLSSPLRRFQFSRGLGLVGLTVGISLATLALRASGWRVGDITGLLLATLALLFVVFRHRTRYLQSLRELAQFHRESVGRDRSLKAIQKSLLDELVLCDAIARNEIEVQRTILRTIAKAREAQGSLLAALGAIRDSQINSTALETVLQCTHHLVEAHLSSILHRGQDDTVSVIVAYRRVVGDSLVLAMPWSGDGEAQRAIIKNALREAIPLSDSLACPEALLFSKRTQRNLIVNDMNEERTRRSLFDGWPLNEHTRSQVKSVFCFAVFPVDPQPTHPVEAILSVYVNRANAFDANSVRLVSGIVERACRELQRDGLRRSVYDELLRSISRISVSQRRS